MNVRGIYRICILLRTDETSSSITVSTTQCVCVCGIVYQRMRMRAVILITKVYFSIVFLAMAQFKTIRWHAICSYISHRWAGMWPMNIRILSLPPSLRLLTHSLTLPLSRSYSHSQTIQWQCVAILPHIYFVYWFYGRSYWDFKIDKLNCGIDIERA